MKKQEKVAAWLILIIIITTISYGLTSEEVDDICTTNNMLLKRISNTWVCYNETQIINSTHYNLNAQSYNTSGNITGNTIYGMIYIHNESNADTLIASANTYVNITQSLQAGPMNGFTYLTGTGITVQVSGTYLVDMHVGFSQAGGAGDEWHIALGINGQEQDQCHAPRKISTITDYGSAGSTCIISLTQGQVITGMIENENDADDANIMDMQITVTRIGN